MADKKNKTKPKGKAKGKADAAGAGMVSVAAHPRAGAAVRRAKGWGGLAGFAIAAYLSLQASVPLVMVGERALAAGAVGYIVAWAISVSVWRHLVIAEMHAHAERMRPQSTEPAPVPIAQQPNPHGPVS